jgi:hypothetical protein
MTWEDYQAILETLEILSDDKAVDQLRRSIMLQNNQSGRSIT